MYNYSFNNVLNSNVLTSSNCGSNIRFVGQSNVRTFTPPTFNNGSSLGHFNDICNSQNFVMNNNIGVNVVKRFFRPEERNTLGNLGYNVNAVYNYCFGTSNQASTNYTGTISGVSVAGMNDGISFNGAYSYIGNTGTNISINGILSNDTNATGFECLEDVYSTSSLSVTSGTPSTSINFSSNVQGLHLLRYVPINGTQKGNITYVYVYVRNSNCTPSPCNIVNNGGFENSNLCGAFGESNPLPTIECWEVLAQTPDLFKRNCTNVSSMNYPNGLYNLNSYTIYNLPAVNSHNNSSNNSLIGLYRSGSSTNPNINSFLEALQTSLGSSLISQQQYTINFWARVGNNVTSNNTSVSIPVTFSSYESILVPISLQGNNFSSVVPNSFQLAPTTLVPNDNSWHFYTYNFTFDSVNNHNAIAVYTGASQSNRSYVYIDDVSITPVNQGSLNLPDSICINESINLATFLDATPFNGTFSGNGVSGNSFTATTVGVNTITYTYTNSTSCLITISDQIEVIECCNCLNNIGWVSEQPSSRNPYGRYCVTGVTCNLTTNTLEYTWFLTNGTTVVTSNSCISRNQGGQIVDVNGVVVNLTISTSNEIICNKVLGLCDCLDNALWISVEPQGRDAYYKFCINGLDCPSNVSQQFVWYFTNGTSITTTTNCISEYQNGTILHNNGVVVNLINPNNQSIICSRSFGTTPSNRQINNIEKNKLSTFKMILNPNPMDEILNINIDKFEGKVQIDIFDINGRLVLNENVDFSNSININLSNLNKGVYLIKVSSENQLFSQKLLKN